MRGVAVAVLLASAAFAVATASGASAPPSPWDGVNPFACELQDVGFGTAFPRPGADPFCVEFDKRHQSLADLGFVDFVSKEPARVAAASTKCFYFQSDHWRGSVVQDDDTTKTYEWDGHYYFDKASGDGGVWVTNFSLNGRTFDPTTLPGFPPQYAKYFGPGTGGVVTHDSVQGDPSCVAKAKAKSPYAVAPATVRPRCVSADGDVGAGHLGPVAIGMPETKVRAVLGRPFRVKRGFLRYCIAGGGKDMVGLPGDRSGDTGAAAGDPVRFLLTSSPAYAARGIARGATRAALERAWPHAREWFVIGRTQVLVLRPGLIAGVRFGRVRLLAVYDTRHVRGRAAVSDWLRRSA